MFPFRDLPHAALMFQSGPSPAPSPGDAIPGRWQCAIGKSFLHLFWPSSHVNANVLFSNHPDLVAAGNPTNVLQRRDPGNPEDPWVGCRGHHLDDHAAYGGVFMMYGEASSPDHRAALITKGGMAVLVR